MLLQLFFIICFVVQACQSVPNSCITCVNCQDVYDGTDASSNCSLTTADADSCQKTRIQFPGSTLILKSCAKNCKEQSLVAGIFRLDITCCTTDNCNQAKRIFIEPTLLIVVFILYFMFIK